MPRHDSQCRQPIGGEKRRGLFAKSADSLRAAAWANTTFSATGQKQAAKTDKRSRPGTKRSRRGGSSDPPDRSAGSFWGGGAEVFTGGPGLFVPVPAP
eukprot:3054980-Pyramimonas_sp.AAC.1